MFPPAETSEFYFVVSSVRKSVWTFVHQLRGRRRPAGFLERLTPEKFDAVLHRRMVLIITDRRTSENPPHVLCVWRVDEAMIREAAIKMNRGAKARRAVTAQRPRLRPAKTKTRRTPAGWHEPGRMAAARVAGMQAIWRRDPNVTLMVEADAVIEELGDPSHVGGARTNWLQQLISPLEARLRFARLLQRS